MNNAKTKDAPSATKLNKGISNNNHDKYSKNTKVTSKHFGWASEYELTKYEADQIADPTWIIKDLIISGHIVLIPAEPNGGKTTIMFDQAGEMTKKGYEVFYVNADISGGDAKPMVKQAKANGFTLMLPDMKLNMSINTVFKKLDEISKTEDRYDNVVFIFDTLKKIIDVIIKSQAKKLFMLLRKLSAKGMTIVLLAHTNKYKDDEGAPIYEGTGDMRSDVDDLIYLIPQKHDDGSMIVTTKPDKQRGSFKPISFNISKNREVTRLDEPVDTISSNKIQEDLNRDKPIINAINSVLSVGSTNQKEIILLCSERDGIGERAVKKVLSNYSYSQSESKKNEERSDEIKLWLKERGDKNSYNYSIPTDEPI